MSLKSGTPTRRTRKKAKVVSLWRGIAPPVPIVQPEIVECIESLLKKAKEGQITGIAYAIVKPSNSIGTCWVGKCDQHLLIAGVRALDHRIMSGYGEVD
jgi:hypothetical protein